MGVPDQRISYHNVVFNEIYLHPSGRVHLASLTLRRSGARAISMEPIDAVSRSIWFSSEVAAAKPGLLDNRATALARSLIRPLSDSTPPCSPKQGEAQEPTGGQAAALQCALRRGWHPAAGIVKAPDGAYTFAIPVDQTGTLQRMANGSRCWIWITGSAPVAELADAVGVWASRMGAGFLMWGDAAMHFSPSKLQQYVGATVNGLALRGGSGCHGQGRIRSKADQSMCGGAMSRASPGGSSIMSAKQKPNRKRCRGQWACACTGRSMV
jgi:hypothetical protein